MYTAKPNNTFAIVTLDSVIPVNRLSGMAKREDSRNIARALRPYAAKAGITVKADIKEGATWGAKFVHNDGKGTLSLRK